MKALSLWQPWATLVVLGAKQIETRSWHPAHVRGRIAIHASKMWSKVQEDICATEPFASALAGAGRRYDGSPEVYQHILPRGCLLGTVELLDCVPTDAVLDGPATSYLPPGLGTAGMLIVSKRERLLGDYHSGRWAWVLREPRAYSQPIPWSGGLSLFPVPDPEWS